MPLLAVPDGVPFIAVTKAVFALRARAERRHLEWALATQRALTAAAVSPGGLGGILAAHGRATGCDAVVVDLLGRPLAGGPARLVDELAGLTAQVRAQGLLGAGVDIDGERRREVHPLGSRRLRAVLLLDGPTAAPAANQVTSALVSLLSLELERHHGLGAAERRGRAQLLAHFARGTVDDDVAARRLAAAGLPERELRAAVIAAEQVTDRGRPRARRPRRRPDRQARCRPGRRPRCRPGRRSRCRPGRRSRCRPRWRAADRCRAPRRSRGGRRGRSGRSGRRPQRRAAGRAGADRGGGGRAGRPGDVDLDAALAVLAAGRPAGIGIAARPGALAVSLRQARSALPESRVRGQARPRRRPRGRPHPPGGGSRRSGCAPTPTPCWGTSTPTRARPSCCAPSPRSASTTGTGSARRRRWACTATPCATASKRSNSAPAASGRRAGPPRAVARHPGPRPAVTLHRSGADDRRLRTASTTTPTTSSAITT